MGFEPTRSVWKTDRLTIDLILACVRVRRLELLMLLTAPGPKPGGIAATRYSVAEETGFEPVVDLIPLIFSKDAQ